MRVPEDDDKSNLATKAHPFETVRGQVVPSLLELSCCIYLLLTSFLCAEGPPPRSLPVSHTEKKKRHIDRHFSRKDNCLQGRKADRV